MRSAAGERVHRVFFRRCWRAELVLAACTVVAGCGTGPVNPQLRGESADRQLETVIGRRLSADHRLCPYAITVTSTRRTVRLEGLVSSPVERERAGDVAARAGADRVINRLYISSGSGDRTRC